VTVDWTKTLLLWDPGDPRLLDLDVRAFEAAGFQMLEVSYDRIGRDPELVRKIQERDIEAVIFTRNDEMPGNPQIGPFLAHARMGYTCLSGIDRERQREQSRECIEDILSGEGSVSLPEVAGVDQPEPGGERVGTFSLVFDLEQLGGARFGLPRLLPMLESRGIAATFFVTGFVAAIYPDAIRRIVQGGHEIGAHGSFHEFLQGRALDVQTSLVRENVSQLKAFSDVTGANYVYRMDGVSPKAMLDAGLRYCVLVRRQLFYLTRFMEASCRPRMLRTRIGDLTMLPVSVETYGGDKPSIRAEITRAVQRSAKEGTNHISLLMHPFKDGCRDRLHLTTWVMDYLTKELKLRPVRLDRVPHPPAVGGDAIEVGYRWYGWEPAIPGGIEVGAASRRWWIPIIYHARRAEELADALSRLGHEAVFSSSSEPARSRASIYPEYPNTGEPRITIDPLSWPVKCAEKVAAAVDEGHSPCIVPPSRWQDLRAFCLYHLPRSFDDVGFFLRRQWGKLVRRLCRVTRIKM
jgi:peptidoglycan/xylan/chitin deacetylase (PgdA/CDA1 family)